MQTAFVRPMRMSGRVLSVAQQVVPPKAIYFILRNLCDRGCRTSMLTVYELVGGASRKIELFVL